MSFRSWSAKITSSYIKNFLRFGLLMRIWVQTLRQNKCMQKKDRQQLGTNDFYFVIISYKNVAFFVSNDVMYLIFNIILLYIKLCTIWARFVFFVICVAFLSNCFSSSNIKFHSFVNNNNMLYKYYLQQSSVSLFFRQTLHSR